MVSGKTFGSGELGGAQFAATHANVDAMGSLEMPCESFLGDEAFGAISSGARNARTTGGVVEG